MRTSNSTLKSPREQQRPFSCIGKLTNNGDGSNFYIEASPVPPFPPLPASNWKTNGYVVNIADKSTGLDKSIRSLILRTYPDGTSAVASGSGGILFSCYWPIVSVGLTGEPLFDELLFVGAFLRGVYALLERADGVADPLFNKLIGNGYYFGKVTNRFGGGSAGQLI